MIDQAQQLRSLAQDRGHSVFGSGRCRVVTVTGGKGGVGKSSISLNLAIALAAGGRRVLLFDADLGLANLDLMLGVVPQRTIEDVSKGSCRLADILLHTQHGIDLLPGGAGVPELASMGSLSLVRMLGQLRELEDSYDVMVIDTAAGIGEGVARFALPADDCVLVCTPDPPAMLDAYSVIKMLCSRQYSGNLHLVVNMLRAEGELERTHASLDRVTRRYQERGINLLGGIPYDEQMYECTRRQAPLLGMFPQGRCARAINALVAVLDGQAAVLPEPERRGFFGRLMDSVRRMAVTDAR
ncbi:P-loop NTPase [bacterium]|nr:P-loop NTPase [bacterium]